MYFSAWRIEISAVRASAAGSGGGAGGGGGGGGREVGGGGGGGGGGARGGGGGGGGGRRVDGGRARLRDGAGRIFDDAGAEQAEQAVLSLLGGHGNEERDLASGEGPVYAGQHEAVARGERDLLEAEEGVAGKGQQAVNVAEGVADDVGIPHLLNRLQDQLPGGELQGQLLVHRLFGLLLEPVGALEPGEDLGQDLVHLEGHGIFQAPLVHDPELDEGLAQPLLLAQHHLGGPGQIRGGQESLADQHLPQVVRGHVGLGVDDGPPAEADAAQFVPLGEMKKARLAADVELPEQAGQHALRQGSVHFQKAPSNPRIAAV